MPSSTSLSFQPICPNGSKFFACPTGIKFIGCCATTLNPCTTSSSSSSGCAPSKLKAASFSADAYGTFPDQECPAGSLWYTCKETRPPFWGCCRVNACTERGCLGGVEGNLSGAFLSSNSSVAAAFLSMVGSSYSTSNSASASASATGLIAGSSARTSSSSSSVAATTTTTTAPTITTSSSSTSKNTISSIGAIAGGTVAGVAVIIAFLLVLFFSYRRRKATAPTTVAATATAATDGGGGGATSISMIHHQQPPSNTQHMLGNNQNTHPALRKPETSPVAAVEEHGFKQSVPNMGESQIEAYESHKYHQTLPPQAFPICNLLNRNPPIRPTPPPSYIISEIDGTPIFPSSPAPPAPNTFPPAPPIRAYSACSELASSERDTRAEMEGDSPTQPTGRREMVESNKEKRMMMMMSAK